MSEAENQHRFDDHVFAVSDSGMDLDNELYLSLVAMAQQENQQSDCNQSSLRILLTASAWFIAGSMVWALVGISI